MKRETKKKQQIHQEELGIKKHTKARLTNQNTQMIYKAVHIRTNET